MLDDSGSMKGEPWDDLMKAFTKFMSILEKDENMRNNSRISVINHNHKSIIYFEEKEPNV